MRQSQESQAKPFSEYDEEVGSITQVCRDDEQNRPYRPPARSLAVFCSRQRPQIPANFLPPGLVPAAIRCDEPEDSSRAVVYVVYVTGSILANGKRRFFRPCLLIQSSDSL